MTRLSAHLAAGIGALLVFGAGSARADYLNWTYTLSLTGGPNFLSSPDNLASIAFAVPSSSTPGALVIPPFGNLNLVNPNSSAESFSAANDSFDIKMTITDKGSGNQQGVLDWHGSFTGTINPQAGPNDSSGVTFALNNPEQKITFAGHTYDFTLTPGSTNINGPDGAPITISGTGTVTTSTDSGGGNTGPATTPEPSSLLLAGSALGLALARWRKQSLRPKVA